MNGKWGLIMVKTKLRCLLKEGEVIYYKKECENFFSFFYIKPGTKDDYTHYLYVDPKTNFFLEYDKKRQSTYPVSTYTVDVILEELEREQEEVHEFLTQPTS